MREWIKENIEFENPWCCFIGTVVIVLQFVLSFFD